MARRQKTVSTSEGPLTAVLEPDGSAFVVETDIETRLAALESQLVECKSLITSQQLKLGQAEDNSKRLRASREKVARLEAAADAAKKIANSTKKSYEAGVEAHFKLEEELTSGQQQLPLTDPEPAARADEDWRAVILDTLGIGKTIIAKLFEANICTVGDISDFCKPTKSGYTKAITDIPGIGEVSAEEIERALELFWAERAEKGGDSEPLDLDDTLAAHCRKAEASADGDMADEFDTGDMADEDFDA